MEGGHIREETDHTYSEMPDNSSSFGRLLELAKKNKTQKAPLLEEISRSEDKKKIILNALTSSNLDWIDLAYLEDNEEAARSFGHLLAHWDTPFDGKPKSKEHHEAEDLAFAKLLKSS